MSSNQNIFNPFDSIDYAFPSLMPLGHRTSQSQGQEVADVDVTRIREAFVNALPRLADHPVWRVLCSRIQIFTLSIGCPIAASEPLECIANIRIHLNSAQPSRATVAVSQRDQRKNSPPEANRSHEDYTVVWICPLEVEQIAALEMLDEEHSRLPQPIVDNNIYTLGGIAGHNIVIAGLPQADNNSAAAVVTQARATFPNLRFCLLVGIGGGVPTTTDNGNIRLGDIVVSKPNSGHSGVVQYARGRAEEGHFQRTGALAPPPSLLLGAAQALAAQRARSTSDPVVGNVARIDTNRQGLARYRYPGLTQDRLYQSDYPHQQVGGPCDYQCNPSRLIQRANDEEEGHEPFIVVHRGTIASGELVIKSGTLRDELAHQYNVLCFETEAAGTLTGLPCMVIRGISDYCDSHKNNQWQGYAAGVAAAYARALFFHLPTAS